MPPVLIVLLVFVGFYGLLIAASFRWVRYRLDKRIKQIAQSLEQAGARILERRYSPHAWRPAEIDVEIDGKKMTVSVRQWARDFQLVKVLLPSTPMPPIMIRQELGIDRLGKAMGMTQEIQLGDAGFDAAHFIRTSAPEAIVREILASDATRRVIADIVGHRYSVFMSADGLGAATLTPMAAWGYGLWTNMFDPQMLLTMVRKLEQLGDTLPNVGREHAAPLAVWRPPFRAMLAGLVGASTAGFAIALMSSLMHRTIDGRGAGFGALLGLALVPVVVLIAAKMLRGRPMAVLEVLIVAGASLFIIPVATMTTVIGLNSGLDRAPPEHHRTHVIRHYRHERRTLYVEPWIAGVSQQKVILPGTARAPADGDLLDLAVHPGAFGWPWISDSQIVE